MNVYGTWKQKVNGESYAVRMGVQIRELCEWGINVIALS